MFQKQDGKIILTRSQVSWPLRSLSLVYTWELTHIPLYWTGFQFGTWGSNSRAHWPTLKPQIRARGQRNEVTRSFSVPLVLAAALSLCCATFIPLFCWKKTRLPAAGIVQGTTSGFWCLHLLIICRSNSRINEMKASLLFSHRFRL